MKGKLPCLRGPNGEEVRINTQVFPPFYPPTYFWYHPVATLTWKPAGKRAQRKWLMKALPTERQESGREGWETDLAELVENNQRTYNGGVSGTMIHHKAMLNSMMVLAIP